MKILIWRKQKCQEDIAILNMYALNNKAVNIYKLKADKTERRKREIHKYG